ncbi:LLM class flavin-dependent oxidoreductase [Kutzneria sp. NPDC052558]|uniref:LLM class flavin-dependent oxidoreductase n=1 Tax=Kutzneria sp. NPDC052558 TaxID=3364121 RepID=UPI0037C62EB8
MSASRDIDRATTDEKYGDFFREVEWANDKGFAGVWITEHHFSTYSLSSSPLLLLTKAATVAPDLRVGTGILVLPLWDPVRLVADVCTLDAISGGRVDLGIGRGYQSHEFHGYGRDLADSRSMFEESVDLITQLLTSEDTTFDGRHYHVDAPVTVLPRPTQTPHPPIWLASVSPESTRFAVTRGFNFMGLALATPAELAQQWRTIEDIAAETGQSVTGRQYSANRYVYCTTDPDGRRMAAREAARQMAMSRALAKGAAPVHGVAPAPAEIDPADEALAYERLLAGTPEEIVAQIEEIADSGVTYISAGFQYGAMSTEASVRSMKLFAEGVLPAFAGTTGAATPAFS